MASRISRCSWSTIHRAVRAAEAHERPAVGLGRVPQPGHAGRPAARWRSRRRSPRWNARSSTRNSVRSASAAIRSWSACQLVRSRRRSGAACSRSARAARAAHASGRARRARAGSSRGTRAPLLAVCSVRPSASSMRSASRTGSRLVPSRSATSSWRIRSPGRDLAGEDRRRAGGRRCARWRAGAGRRRDVRVGGHCVRQPRCRRSNALPPG